MDFWTALILLSAAGIAWALVGGISRLWLSPLSKFPGPKFTALTLWNEFYWDVVKRGSFIWKIQEMHDQYGPIVRINPYELHIRDADFYNELYASSRRMDKYEWWTQMAGSPGSGFSTISHDLHRQRRGALNNFFSARSVAQLEPMIQAKIDKLLGRLERVASTGEVLRLDAAFMALTTDIISEYAFSNAMGCLDQPDFELGLAWKRTILGAFEGGTISRQFPWMLPLMQRLPLSVVAALNPAAAYLFKWQEKVKQQVAPILDRTDEKSAGGGGDKPGRTIFHTLRDSDLPAEERTLERLCDEGNILIGAGSETVAQTLTRLCFYLRHVPSVLVKLREELDRESPARGENQLAGLQQLPYLSAVIREALRLSYGVTTRLPRIAHEDIRYKGWVIPSGTPVSETSTFVLLDPTVFPEPESFRPERWLEGGKLGTNLDRYLVAFGKGSRQCLGINLAYAELYLTTAAVVRRFDWEMYETKLEDIVLHSDFFVGVGASDVYGKGVRVKMASRAAQRKHC